MLRFLTLIMLFPSLCLANWDFYVFQNGVHFPSDQKAAETLKELGYSGIGSAKLPGLEKRLETYHQHGLRIHSLYVGAVLNKGKAADPDPNLLHAMNRLDEGSVVEFWLRGDAPDEEIIPYLRKLAVEAHRRKQKVVLYPHTGFLVDTFGDAVRLARKVKHPNLGAMFNLCHFLKVEPGADLRKTIESGKDVLMQVSTSGADGDGKSWNTLIQPLDQGNVDQIAFFTILKEVGFTGKVGLQCYGIKGDARVNLQKSIAAWKKIEKEIFP